MSAVTLVGDSGQLRAELARYPDAAGLDILVVHAADAVGMGERPAEALRRKPRSSIRVAAGLVSDGAADALFSAGNTGATVMAAYTALRPAAGAPTGPPSRRPYPRCAGPRSCSTSAPTPTAARRTWSPSP